MVSIVTSLVHAIVEAIQLIKCDSIVPIYQQTIYNGTCDYNMKAMLWVFAASIICTFFGFLMITFRSSYSATVYNKYPNDSEYGRNSALLEENDPSTSDELHNSHVDEDSAIRSVETHEL